MRAADVEAFIKSNILLDGVMKHRTSADWLHDMSHNPYAGVDISRMAPMAIDVLPAMVKDNSFVATPMSVNAARSIISMVVRGLMDRHPKNDAFKRLPIEIAKRKEQKLEAAMFPWLRANARGVLIEGIHGTGKSHLIERVLTLLPQVIDRGDVPELGMKSFKQLVYLVVHMPTDASKGGFVMQAFREIDGVLGTDYYETYRNLKTVELQINTLISVLLLHRCGLLVIEESQAVHKIDEVRFGNDFASFMLKVMNFGIPLVTIGNPLAFDSLRQNTQIMGRLKADGHFELMPSPHWEDEVWKSVLVPTVSSMTFHERDDARVRHLPEILWHATGGLPKHLMNVRRGTLETSLAWGADRVTLRHLKEGIKVARGYGDMELIDMLIKRDNGIETRKDVPGRAFSALWRSTTLPQRMVPEDFYA